mmetsp:Transcript_10402/g.16311  ORF Transcript_10402/g.16311 Transcript_10402/m.16311 type:complete len:283 (-) Transcript_10402:8-856(-)
MSCPYTTCELTAETLQMADSTMGEVAGAFHLPLESRQTPFWGAVLENIRAMVGELQLDLVKYQRMGYCLLELSHAAVRRADFLKAENNMISQHLNYVKRFAHLNLPPASPKAWRVHEQQLETSDASNGSLDNNVDDQIEALLKVLSELVHVSRPAEPGTTLRRKDVGADVYDHIYSTPDIHAQAMTGPFPERVPLPAFAQEECPKAVPHWVVTGPLPNQIPLPTFAEDDYPHWAASRSAASTAASGSTLLPSNQAFSARLEPAPEFGLSPDDLGLNAKAFAL